MGSCLEVWHFRCQGAYLGKHAFPAPDAFWLHPPSAAKRRAPGWAAPAAARTGAGRAAGARRAPAARRGAAGRAAGGALLGAPARLLGEARLAGAGRLSGCAASQALAPRSQTLWLARRDTRAGSRREGACLLGEARLPGVERLLDTLQVLARRRRQRGLGGQAARDEVGPADHAGCDVCGAAPHAAEGGVVASGHAPGGSRGVGQWDVWVDAVQTAVW